MDSITAFCKKQHAAAIARQDWAAAQDYQDMEAYWKRFFAQQQPASAA